jgi:hypothetical protein
MGKERAIDTQNLVVACAFQASIFCWKPLTPPSSGKAMKRQFPLPEPLSPGSGYGIKFQKKRYRTVSFFSIF